MGYTCSCEQRVWEDVIDVLNKSATHANCGRRVIKRVQDDDELFELWIEGRGSTLVIGEDSEGPLTELAYGERWHRSMAMLDAEALSRAFMGETPEAFLAESDAPLCDLMDRLDWLGIPYRYVSFGSAGLAALRTKRPMMNFSQTLDESPAP